MLHPLLDLLAPPACVACRSPTGRGDPLCRACRAAVPWLGMALCPACGLPRPCGRRCPAARYAFDAAWAPVAYAGPAKQLVGALKERGALAVAGLMAAQIAATAPPGLLEAAVLVPVPADPLRHRRRGVDHARRLAEEVGARTGLPVAPVLRRRHGRRQAGARRRTRVDRGRALGIEVARPAPTAVVLVDDVHTTGATLHACAAALRSGGSLSVAAVTYARTLP